MQKARKPCIRKFVFFKFFLSALHFHHSTHKENHACGFLSYDVSKRAIHDEIYESFWCCTTYNESCGYGCCLCAIFINLDVCDMLNIRNVYCSVGYSAEVSLPKRIRHAHVHKRLFDGSVVFQFHSWHTEIHFQLALLVAYLE